MRVGQSRAWLSIPLNHLLVQQNYQSINSMAAHFAELTTARLGSWSATRASGSESPKKQAGLIRVTARPLPRLNSLKTTAVQQVNTPRPTV